MLSAAWVNCRCFRRFRQYLKTLPLKTCPRCEKSFDENSKDALFPNAVCCPECGMRNLFDGLGMSTPPELLDRHTRKPTLTQEEFRKSLDSRRRSRK